MSTRAKVILVIALAVLVFVAGVTIDWWAGGLLALVAGLFGRAVVKRSGSDPKPGDARDHGPTEYVDPDTGLEDIDDEVTHATTDATTDAAAAHGVDSDTVASDLDWADGVRAAEQVPESGESERAD